MTDSTQKKKYKLPGRPKKRLFIGILTLTTVLVSILLYGIWYIARLGLAEIAEPLPMVVGALFALLSGGAMLAILNMVLAVKGWCGQAEVGRLVYCYQQFAV